MTDSLTTAPRAEAEPPGPPPALRPVELVRWSWRQLTSMRTALVLLFLLALGAVPGSIVPQTGVDPVRVAQFKAAHRTLTPFYERLSLFNVYSAPWFAAIYLLLFVSLAGCVLPRSKAHWRAMRATPPRAPRNLTRLPAHVGWTADGEASAVLDEAEQQLRRRRYRVVRDGDAVSAERGYLRETGNLAFHVALIGLLVAVAVGNLWGWKGSVLVIEKTGFSNTLSAYDSFSHGARFDEGRLAPFTVELDRMRVRYQTTGDQRGAPRDFRARLSYTAAPGEPGRRYVLRVNHPLVVDGTKVFLVGNGYAPVFTVRDSTGAKVFSGPVPFLPRDGNNTSIGVVKVEGASPQQLGFQGFFLPTGTIDERGPVSTYPDLLLPTVVLTAFRGDLGTSSGVPQSIYKLDTRKMTQITKADGKPLAQALLPGERMQLPAEQGSITFDGVRRYATLQVARDPGKSPALLAAALALVGLMLSLFIRRRRIWVRARAGESGRTLVEVAGLARVEGEDRQGLAGDVAEVAAALGHPVAPSSSRTSTPDEED